MMSEQRDRRTPTGPMTLGNNVDAYPDDATVPSFGPRMRCSKCGHLGAYARPDWRQLRGVPRP
jgi:hypothetical protein